MSEEKAGVETQLKRQNSKKGFKKNEHAVCLQHGESFRGFGSFCPSVFNADRPDSKNSMLSRVV